MPSIRCERLASYVLVQCVVTLLALLLPSLGHAATRTICVTADILTDDSGNIVNGTTEDYWSTADNAGETTGYPLRGVRIELKKNNGTGASIGTFDTHPTSGCTVVTNATTGPYQVIVYGYATDSGGNHIRIHDGGTATDVNYPGATYSYGFLNVYLSGAALTLKLDATADERWTTFAAAAQTLYRFHDGLAGKTISIGFDELSSCSSSSSYDSSNSYIQSGAGYSLVKIARCATNQTKRKFLVAHEVGHTIGRQHYGYNGGDLKNSTYPNSAPCTSGGSYGMDSAEHNSIGFAEGYAWFVSAAVWNDRAVPGVVTRNGAVWDLANGPNMDAAGGHIWNVCTSDRDEEGVSTNFDWLRFFWDFYNETHCTYGPPSNYDMQEIYKYTRENHRTGSYVIEDGTSPPANLHLAVANTLANTLSVPLAGCWISTPMDHNCVGGLKLDGSRCNS